MNAKVQKWGNSLAIRIPKAFAREAQVAYGTDVDMTLEAGRIVVEPLARPVYELRDLLAGMTPGNRHAEADTGNPAGREVW